MVSFYNVLGEPDGSAIGQAEVSWGREARSSASEQHELCWAGIWSKTYNFGAVPDIRVLAGELLLPVWRVQSCPEDEALSYD